MRQIIHDATNRGPTAQALREHLITPVEQFFVRSHAPAPRIDPQQYQLSISGMGQHPVQISLDNLKQFSKSSVTATLQCAGNRRKEMHAVQPIRGEIPWDHEAMSTAEWSGVPLHLVLKELGIQDGAAHVDFIGLDRIHKQGKVMGFGSSITLQKALQPEVLLAYEMNGSLLTPEHGAPLRLIVPGYIGARSVKWLGQINIQSQPSQNYFYTHAYRMFPAHIHARNVIWEQGIPLEETLLNAIICTPQDGARIGDSPVEIKGIAIAGGDCVLRGVEISIDGDSTWQEAHLINQPQQWMWCFWEATLPGLKQQDHLIVRAWDTSNNPQPAQISDVWNFKGYLNNAWHRIQTA